MQVELKNIYKKIKKTSILDNINIEFNSGHIYGIVGANGSGKTMLLRTIIGLTPPTNGRVYVDGKMLHKDFSFLPDVGILIEKPDFLGYLTGFQNLRIFADVKNLVSDEEIKQFMINFGLDPEDPKPVRHYSLGMKQKLGIIQAIMENQQALILDEPFNALDEDTVSLLRNLLLEYKNNGKLIVITSHHKEDIESICDYTYKIANGKIV